MKKKAIINLRMSYDYIVLIIIYNGHKCCIIVFFIVNNPGINLFDDPIIFINKKAS